MQHMHNKLIDKLWNQNSKYADEIKSIEYQISVGCRKLRSATTISKELVKAGFKRAEYEASGMVRGWGSWKGEFKIVNNPTYIFINWRSKSEKRFEEFYKYLSDIYGNDVSKDEYKNITLMK